MNKHLRKNPKFTQEPQRKKASNLRGVCGTHGTFDENDYFFVSVRWKTGYPLD